MRKFEKGNVSLHDKSKFDNNRENVFFLPMHTQNAFLGNPFFPTLSTFFLVVFFLVGFLFSFFNVYRVIHFKCIILNVHTNETLSETRSETYVSDTVSDQNEKCF